MQRVQEAAKLAFAHDFIEDLPQGYYTRVGERGGLLSGGQKQRVAIARSVISEPRILLLDEATSALDPHAEDVVQKALDSASKNRTTVVIAHKLATIRSADNIVVMSGGKIVEQGCHKDLVARNNVYAALVKAQNLAPATKADLEDLGNTSTTDSLPQKEHFPSDESQSLARIQTAQRQRLEAAETRENHDLYPKTGIIRNIWKLLKRTPDIWLWFAITVATCVAGGK